MSLRGAQAALAALLSIATVAPAAAQVAALFAPYTQPGQRVAVAAGRRINLVCLGQGSPTVVLSAGLLAWSSTWLLVQPQLSKTTRVCAWDRAGYGFSDPSGEPQDIVHTEADLERALDAAGIAGPLVLVGHSLGAVETLLFADRHPDRVAGLVLVDPTAPDGVRRFADAAPAVMAFSGRGDAQFAGGLDRCLAALGGLRRDPPPPECAALRAGWPEPVRTALGPSAGDPAQWATFRSSYAQRDHDSMLAINPRRDYGAIPMVVLGAGRLPLPGAPPDVAAQVPALQAEIRRGEEELAHLSRRGAFVLVPDSAHAIHLQKPSAVIEAVQQVVDETRAGPH